MITSTNSRAACLLITLLGAAYSSPTTAKVNYADNSGFSITNVSKSQAPVEVVYSHFIQHVDMWWPKDHTWWEGVLRIDEQAGGCFCETLDSASAVHMQISVIEPNKKVVMTGGLGPLQEMGITGALTWEFSSIENNTAANTDTAVDMPNKTQVTLTYNASGNIHFNGEKASVDDAVNLVNVVDKVQAQQLNALTAFSDKN